MPLICKESVELTANTYAVITGKKVHIIVHNSDPFLQTNQNIELNINKIYEVTNKESYKDRLRCINTKDLDDIYKVSKAISSGILLVLPYKNELIQRRKE